LGGWLDLMFLEVFSNLEFYDSIRTGMKAKDRSMLIIYASLV